MRAIALKITALTALLAFSMPVFADEQLSGTMPSIESLDSAIKSMTMGQPQSTLSPTEAAASMAAPIEPPLAPPIMGMPAQTPYPPIAPPQAQAAVQAQLPVTAQGAPGAQTTIDPKTHKFSTPVLYVYEFSAKWCPSCRQLAPVVEQAAEKYNGFIKFIPINVDKNQDLVKKLNVAQIPTVMVIDGRGRMLNRLIGLQQGSQIDVILDHYKQQTLASLAGRGTN